MICAKLKPAVSGLESDFPGRVKAENLDASTEKSQKEIKALGFKSHGLVVRSADGTPVFKQADHTVDIETVKKKLAELLEKSH